MHPKYSNIFWHQGVKMFAREQLDRPGMRSRIEHLENDVTKALLNLFEHCDNRILGEFLKFIGVHDHPASFAFDFQVRDTSAYRNHRNRIMLSLVGAACEIRSEPAYAAEKSIPDACIFNDTTAILIEAKTQSALIPEQIESHVRQYFGTATARKTKTWEEVSERLSGLKALDDRSELLASHFRAFLELIGLAEFKGFQTSDFETLWSIHGIGREEFMDSKAIVHAKIDKYMKQLSEAVNPVLASLPFAVHVPPLRYGPGDWAAIYFHNNDAGLHINHYPNITLQFASNGIEVAVNAEMQHSFETVLRRMEAAPERLSRLMSHFDDYRVSLHWKLQYLPKDNFIVDLVPGYPQPASRVGSDSLRTDIDSMRETWGKYRTTLLYRMEQGKLLQEQGRRFTAKELAHARDRNPKPNFVFKLEKLLDALEIEKMGGKIVARCAGEIKRLKEIVDFFIGSHE